MDCVVLKVLIKILIKKKTVNIVVFQPGGAHQISCQVALIIRIGTHSPLGYVIQRFSGEILQAKG